MEEHDTELAVREVIDKVHAVGAGPAQISGPLDAGLPEIPLCIRPVPAAAVGDAAKVVIMPLGFEQAVGYAVFFSVFYIFVWQTIDCEMIDN